MRQHTTNSVALHIVQTMKRLSGWVFFVSLYCSGIALGNVRPMNSIFRPFENSMRTCLHENAHSEDMNLVVGDCKDAYLVAYGPLTPVDETCLLIFSHEVDKRSIARTETFNCSLAEEIWKS